MLFSNVPDALTFLQDGKGDRKELVLTSLVHSGP